MFKCFKPVYLFSNWILFLSALLIVPCVTFNCIHDKVDKPQRRSTRSVKYQDIRVERDKDPSLFEPLTVHFYVDKVAITIPINSLRNIEVALDKVKLFLQNTFQVRKRKKPYLIERISCSSKWKTGKNKGKCSAFNNTPELCDTHAIKYVIPDRFLDTLEIYEFNKPEPNISILSGPGLEHSNFITFVTFQHEDFCNKGAIAYGSYCRLDQKTSEPLSGILNLCPQSFSHDFAHFQYYYDVILHEMFHILGFTVKLFDKFVPCSKGIYCPMPQKVIQEDSSKIYRLMFPLVVENMQHHFGCSKSDFGGPLAPKDTKDSSVPYTSHWHPVLMYSSIMTPSFSEFEHLLVDNITLAALASTGWYHVNFSFVETFTFGLKQGCDFGITGECDNRFLCNISSENTGCDIFHKTIGKCETLTADYPCGVYIPNTERDCETVSPRYFDLDFEVVGFKHKCFMLQDVGSAKPEPSCLPLQCRTRDAYSVLVNQTWYPCYHIKEASQHNVTLFCPESDLMCHDAMRPKGILDCPADLYYFVAIRMYFDQPTFEDLLKQRSFKNFKVTTLEAIANKINIPVNYIANSSLSVFKQIFLDFAICPPPDLSASELNQILINTQKFLDGNFVHILKGPGNHFISSNDIAIDPVDAISFSDNDGFRSLLAFPVVCAIFLIASFVASMARLFLLQKHRPRRATEITDDNNIQMSQVE